MLFLAESKFLSSILFFSAIFNSRLTFISQINYVLFSVPEEIFNAAEAVWFSPNGTYLAVASFNDTLVESVVYPIYGNPADVNFQYSQEVRFKYPKVSFTICITNYKLTNM